MMDIDKSKLVLVHDKDDKIIDQKLEGKEIGYYKDSWLRFKRNKASLVAFIIICIMFIFVIFGPYMKNYDLYKTSPVEASKFSGLSPRIPGLEKLGILNGRKKLQAGKKFLVDMYHSEEGKGIIIKGMPQELIDDPNHPDYENVSMLEVVVDHYRYVDYINSYKPETFYSALGAGHANPYDSVTTIYREEEFNKKLEQNLIIDVLKIVETKDVNDPDDPNKTSYLYYVREHRFLSSLGQRPEDTYFWFGTTMNGRDLFTEIWKGARISLILAITVLVVNSTVGLTIGAIVGYYGGIVDLIFDRFVEIISSIPFMVVLTLLTLRFGNAIWVIIVAFTATGWIGSYGTGRMQFYRFKNREYVLAARTLGASDARIMAKHIFPNTLGYIVTGYALAIPAFVFTESSYSFLGIINYGSTTSIGMLLQEGQALMHNYGHLLLFPSLYIAILMIAFNLFGNGLRDAFNPAMRGAE